MKFLAIIRRALMPLAVLALVVFGASAVAGANLAAGVAAIVLTVVVAAAFVVPEDVK